MATQISIADWVESATLAGGDVSFEVVILEILHDSVRVQPVIRVGEVVLWQGAEDVMSAMTSITLGGFKYRGGDLILEGFSELV
jgi:hypothetical protein